MKNLLWMPSCIQKAFLTRFLHFWSFFRGPLASQNDPQNAEKRKNVDPKIMLKIVCARICVFTCFFVFSASKVEPKLAMFLNLSENVSFVKALFFLSKIKVFSWSEPTRFHAKSIGARNRETQRQKVARKLFF